MVIKRANFKDGVYPLLSINYAFTAFSRKVLAQGKYYQHNSLVDRPQSVV